MEVFLDPTRARDLSGQIYRQIRQAILDGRLGAGDALPSSRDLHKRVGVSRNTVNVAYQRLVDEGFLVARPGAGTFVGQAVTGRGDGRGAGPDGGRGDLDTAGEGLRPLPLWDRMPEPPDYSAVRARFDLRPGVVDPRLFPFPTWRRMLGDQLRASAVGNAAHADPLGLRALREAIAKHIGVSRGVRADADDVAVTTGIQQGLELATRVLVEPGRTVAVEEPGHPSAVRLFMAAGAKVVPVPVDADGLVVEAIPGDTRAIYVTPSHQCPLGMPMSLGRRMALLEFAESSDAAVFEDDYDCEFRYTGRPVETLHGLDRSGRVLYLGSFSKTMLPTLRLGFMVVPASLRRAVRIVKQLADRHTALPTQAALARFIESGALARHLRTAHRVYQARYHLMRHRLVDDLAEWLEPIPAAAGLHVAAFTRRGDTDDLATVAESALRREVAVWTLSGHYLTEPARAGLMLGFGGIPIEHLDEALTRLRDCLAHALRDVDRR